MDIKRECTASTFRICIDEMSVSDHEIKGKICGIALEGESLFSNSSEFLVLIDKLLDGIGKPQPSRKTRSFQERDGDVTFCQLKPKLYHDPEEILERRGGVMTRDVTFTSRFRSSWQGTVKWVEGKKEVPFQSAIELIKLMDSAMDLPDEDRVMW